MKRMNKNGFMGLLWAALIVFSIGAYHVVKWAVNFGHH
jgi:hypothetical protein